MVKIHVAYVKYYLLSFSTPLVFNKNTFEFSRLRGLFKKKVYLRLNLKVKNSKITTLRAPKHFKVGRHHYQIEKNKILMTFLNSKTNFRNIFENSLPFFLKTTTSLVCSQQPTKPFSIATSVKVSFIINRVFKII